MSAKIDSTLHHGVSLVELEDVDLLDLARRGDADTDAYAVLYDRYVYAARRLARHLGQREETDDVVSESFAQVLDLLQRGKGPDRAFRAYLFTTIRHECGRRAKAAKRVMPTDDIEKIDTAVPFGGGQLDEFEKSAIRDAFESLPARWRKVLWHLDVEGRKPHELAPLLDMKPNSVSALVYRARSALRDAYVQQHVNAAESPESRACRGVRPALAGVVRRTASVREQEKVHAHLETCHDCMRIYLDLQEVNQEVGVIVAPAALAAAVGGGGVVLGAHLGAAVIANVVAALKAAVVAASVPAAAVALTGTAVVTMPEPAPDVVVSSPSELVPADPAPRPVRVAATAPVVVKDRHPAAAGPAEVPAPPKRHTPGPAETPPVPKAQAPAATPPVPKAQAPAGAAAVVKPDGVEVTRLVTASTKAVTTEVQTVHRTVEVVRSVTDPLLPD